MMRNKKGVSDIIVTVILIVIALVAVGVVWAVVQGIVKGQSSNAQSATTCLSLGAEITKVTKMADGSFEIVVKRTNSYTGDAFIRLVGTDTASGESGIFILTPFAGKLSAPLATATFTTNVLSVTDVKTIEATPYIKDSAGAITYCEQQKTSTTKITACTPNCATATACGDSDGCGGKCTVQSCTALQTCTAGVCA
jgi:flagellin-like protein